MDLITNFFSSIWGNITYAYTALGKDVMVSLISQLISGTILATVLGLVAFIYAIIQWRRRTEANMISFSVHGVIGDRFVILPVAHDMSITDLFRGRPVQRREFIRARNAAMASSSSIVELGDEYSDAIMSIIRKHCFSGDFQHYRSLLTGPSQEWSIAITFETDGRVDMRRPRIMLTAVEDLTSEAVAKLNAKAPNLKFRKAHNRQRIITIGEIATWWQSLIAKVANAEGDSATSTYSATEY